MGLGIIGVFVPVLPTTPFLLLAATCFLRSSPRVHKWLLSSRLLGGYIRHYHEGTGVPRPMKIRAITLLWLTIGTSAVFFVDNFWIRILLLAIAISVTIHIATIKPKSY